MLKIVEMRREKNIKQTDLARVIGIKGNRLCQYEKGNRKPSLEIIKKIAKALDCKIEDLID